MLISPSTAAEQVTGGKIAVSIKYGIIPVYSTTLDLCTELKAAGITCPVAAGDHTATLSGTVPESIPGVSNAISAPR